MYRFILTLIVIPTFFFGQVGVNTLYPIGVFHVDGGGDNPASSPTINNLANDFLVDSRGNVGIGTTTLYAHTRMTILPNATDRNGIHFEYPGSGTISSPSRAININVSTNANIDGLLYTNSTTANSSFYGVGSELSAGNIVSSYLGYRNGSGLSYGLLTITGTTSVYSRTANTWALFSRGRAEISADSSPSDIAGVDLQIRNTTSGASNPATVMMRQSTSQTTNNNLLARLDFGDAHDTSTQARIEVARDAAGGAGDFPTRITFSTTADGSSTLTERMRISNNGFVGIATVGAASSTLSVNGHVNFKHDVLNGGSSGSATPIDNHFYISLNPTSASNNEFFLPTSAHVTGRMYILRNISSSFNARIFGNGGSARFLPSDNFSTATDLTLATNNSTKTIYLLFDGTNWTWGAFGF